MASVRIYLLTWTTTTTTIYLFVNTNQRVTLIGEIGEQFRKCLGERRSQSCNSKLEWEETKEDKTNNENPRGNCLKFGHESEERETEFEIPT